MNISNNSLSAFMANKSTKKEDRTILSELESNAEFSDLLDILTDVDAIDGLDELKNEFNESIDMFNEISNFNELNNTKL